MGHTEREADIYWTNSHINNWEGLPQSHIPIFQHTMRRQEDIRGKTHWVEKPNIPWEKKKTVIQRHLVAQAGIQLPSSLHQI